MFIDNNNGKNKTALRWFRFYNDALDDPKVQRLAPHLFKTWINLLCLASKDQGRLPGDDDIAFRLRISVADAAQQVSDLILAGLIDILPDGSRTPHNWTERQYPSDTSTERMRKNRKSKKKKQSDVTCDVTCDASDAKSDGLEKRREEKIREDKKEDITSIQPEAPREAEGRQNLQSVFNGSTDAMLADVQAWMGPLARQDNATKWLTGTLSAYGAERTAQAWTIVTAKQARGEPVGNPLALWSKTAGGLRSSGQPDQKPCAKVAGAIRARQALERMKASMGAN